LIAGVTVIWTRQKSTGTGVVKPGGVKLFAATELAVIEITSGKTRLESLVQLSAAGAASTAVDAASVAAKPQSPESLARSVTCFLPCDPAARRPDFYDIRGSAKSAAASRAYVLLVPVFSYYQYFLLRR
jgi:hypothetical protein